MNRVEIVKKDLKYNIEKIFEKANEHGKCDNGKMLQIIAVVKCNGYGLGLVELSEFLIENGVNYLAVATYEEAYTLRENNITCPILLMTPVIEKKELRKLVSQNIILTIGSTEEADLIDNIFDELGVKDVKVQVKIDTGFTRYGFNYKETSKVLDIFKNGHLNVCGMYSHFSDAMDEKWTSLQFDRFISVLEAVKMNGYDPGLLHVSNSVAFLKYPNMRLNAVRIGTCWTGRVLYDLGNLKHIGTLKSKILEIRQVEKGTNVSYIKQYTTKKPAKLATIPIGYIDGFNHEKQRDIYTVGANFKNSLKELFSTFKTKRLQVTINGKKANVVGKLGTHHAIVDVTNIDCKVGDDCIFNVNPMIVNSDIKREYV